MKILLIYATYSGSTLEASNHIVNQLNKKGYFVFLKEAHEVSNVDFYNSDLVLLGSPTWGDGELHDSFIKLIERSQYDDFSNIDFAIFVLGDKSYGHFCGAVEPLEKFVKDKKGKLIIDSLKINSFYFNQEESISLINEWLDRIKYE